MRFPDSLRRSATAVILLFGCSTIAHAANSFSEAATPRNPDKPPIGNSLPAANSTKAAVVMRPKGTITVYTSRATFQAAFPGLPSEDFEEGNAPGGGFTVCDSPLDAAGDATCGFAVGTITAGAAYQDNPGPDAASLILLGAGTSLNATKVLVSNTFADSFDIIFDPPVSAAGMDLHSTPAPGQGPPDVLGISVFDANDVLIDSDPAAAASGAGNFWGVSSATQIGRISILSTNNQAEGVDNIEYAGAPALVVSDVTNVDQCAAPPSNVNGILEPGEALSIDVELGAVSGAFTGIVGTLTSSTPGVTIIDGVANYADLAAGASAFGNTPFLVTIDSTVGCLSQVDFDLAIASNQGPFTASLSNPVGQALDPTGLPLAIPDNDPLGASSDLVVADPVILTDVDVRVAATHTWVGDLTLTLEGPNGAMVVLLDRPGVPATTVGCDDDNIDVTFDDASGFDPEPHCVGTDPWLVGSANPTGTLSTFNGLSAAGTWSLHVTDGAGQDVGTIDDWELITTPAIAGVCTTCTNNGLVQAAPEQPVPTLNWQALVALASALGLMTLVALRRRNHDRSI